MRVNSLHAARVFVDLVDDFLGDTISMGYDVMVQLLDRSKINAFSKKTFQRLVPDVNLDAKYPGEQINASDVKEVLGLTEQKHFDKKILLRSVAEASAQEPENAKDQETSVKVEKPNMPMEEDVRAVMDRLRKKVETQLKFPTTEKSVEEMPVVEAETVAVSETPHLYKLNACPSDTLVIHCGDPRFQDAFKDFIVNELQIRNYTPIVIGGGLHSFGVQSIRPKNFKILWEQIKFFVKEGNLHKVIFINHEDCQWYKKMRGRRPETELPRVGKLDLITAGTQIIEDFTGVDVESYFARLAGDTIVFEQIRD